MTRTHKRWVAALGRHMGVDANPLRRGCDRAEAWLRLGLVLVFLIASPLAAFGLGHLTNDASIRAARAEAANEHYVPAVLLHRVSRNSDDPLYSTSELAWAQARWTAPDGRRRVGEVPAAVGSRAGREVHIWVDHSGQLVYPPIGQGQIASRVIAVVALTPAILAIMLLGVGWLIRRLLDRRRMGGWAAEWSAVEPLWTKRTH
ncbi:MAG: Rv1733c family protein [Streptosporangiaceae bacterium]